MQSKLSMWHPGITYGAPTWPPKVAFSIAAPLVRVVHVEAQTLPVGQSESSWQVCVPQFCWLTSAGNTAGSQQRALPSQLTPPPVKRQPNAWQLTEQLAWSDTSPAPGGQAGGPVAVTVS